MELPVTGDGGGPTVCRMLRSKGTPGQNYGDAVAWDAGFVTTATFWCLATVEPVGPDDYYVHPHVCTAGRACYREPEDVAEANAT